MLIFVYKLKWKSKEWQWNVFIFFIIYIYPLYLFQLDKTMHKTFFFLSLVRSLAVWRNWFLCTECVWFEYAVLMSIICIYKKFNTEKMPDLIPHLRQQMNNRRRKNEKENEKKQSKSDHNKMYFSVSFRAIFGLNTICPFIRFKLSSSITKSNLMGHRKWLSYIVGLLSAANNLPSTFAFRNTF